MLLRTLLLFHLFHCFASNDNENVSLFSAESLRGRLFSHKEDFFCVIIKNTAGNESKAMEMETLLQRSVFNDFFLGSILNTIDLSKLTKISRVDAPSVLRCFFASPLYKDYSGPSKYSSVSKWMQRMIKKHTRLLSKDVKDFQNSIASNDVTIMAVPFLEQVINIQDVLQKVRSRLKSQSSLSILLVHPNSKQQSAIKRHYGIPQNSAVAVFVQTGSIKEVEKTIFTGHNIDDIQITSHIISRLTGVKHLTAKNFQLEALTVKTSERFQPYIVMFYAWWAKHALPFMSCFKSAVEYFKENSVLAKFALVNVAEERAVIPAFLKVYKTPPFIVVFQRETGKYSVNQTTLQGITHPSPYYLFQSLSSIGLSMEDVYGNPWNYPPNPTLDTTQFSDLREGPFGTFCTAWAHNQTDSMFIPEQLPVQPVVEERKPLTIEDLLPKHQGVPILTEDFWDVSVKKSESSFGIHTSVSKVVVSVFAFIRIGCGSCDAKMNVFKELHREIKKIANSQFLLVNCSHDVSLCHDLSVNGYPSVVAFRNFAALATERCAIPASEKSIIRRDYHGPIDTWSVYTWCKQLSMPSAQLLEFSHPPPLSKIETDVRLIATLVPKTSVYLPIAPNRDRNYFYSLSCFRLACELLYGLASCQLVYSTKIPSSEFKDKNAMIITEIDFERRDGISMKLMSLGKSLHSTMEEETGTSLHLFHRAHQYLVTPSQTCEQNHDICTQVVVNFTRDHLRLPVTSLTSEIFHTRNNPLFENGKPVLIALAMPDNITATGNFMKMLHRVASTLYKDVLVTVLNVQEYPAWAGSFVPKNYNKYFIAEDHPGPLHSYPRICLVDWQDHSQAAFYPPLYTLMDGIRDTFNVSMETARGSRVSEMIGWDNDDDAEINMWDSEKLISYIGLYLEDPTLFLVKTEYF